MPSSTHELWEASRVITRLTFRVYPQKWTPIKEYHCQLGLLEQNTAPRRASSLQLFYHVAEHLGTLAATPEDSCQRTCSSCSKASLLKETCGPWWPNSLPSDGLEITKHNPSPNDHPQYPFKALSPSVSTLVSIFPRNHKLRIYTQWLGFKEIYPTYSAERLNPTGTASAEALRHGQGTDGSQ